MNFSTFIMMAIPLLAVGAYIGYYFTKEKYEEKNRDEILEVTEQMTKENEILADQFKKIPESLIKFFCIQLKDMPPNEEKYFKIFFWWKYENNKQLRKLINLFHLNGLEIVDEQIVEKTGERKFSLWFPIRATEIKVKPKDGNSFMSHKIIEKKGTSEI